jgi:hypothetical protein
MGNKWAKQDFSSKLNLVLAVNTKGDWLSRTLTKYLVFSKTNYCLHLVIAVLQ